MGRVVNDWQCEGSTECASSSSFHVDPYTYDYMGNVLTSPQGDGGYYLYTYAYDNAGRLASMTRNGGAPNNFFISPQYNALGELTSLELGDQSSNTGITETHTYDNRGRPLTQNSVVNNVAGLYDYSSVTYAGNGNLLTISDSIMGGNTTYTYDDFGRLYGTNWVVNGTTNTFGYVYDRFGNRWQQNVTSGSGPAPQYSFDTHHHIVGATWGSCAANKPNWCYDAAGNLLNDSYHTYTYDAEGRVTNVDGSANSYVYDAQGHRIQRTTSSTTVHYFIDLAGRVLSEYSSSDSWNRGEAYVGRRHLATLANGYVYFDYGDSVGTSRVKSTYTFNSWQSCGSLPFGDQKTCNGPGSNITPNFYTDQPRDTESNTDHFWFRQYSPTQGNWLSPDPEGLAVVSPGDPQSWNRYAYARNNPTNYIDPYGLDWCQDAEGNLIPEDQGGTDNISCAGAGGQWVEWANDVINVVSSVDGNTDPSGVDFGSQIPSFGGFSLGAGGVGGGAANNGLTISAAPHLPWYKNTCITSALGDAALHIGIDAIGLIPEAGGLARMIGHGAGYVGVVADQTGAGVIKAFGGSTGAVQGLAGLGDTSAEGLVSTGLTVAGFIPGLGQAAAVGSIGVDVYKTVKAIGQCH
jgi:RHS repeat-associated protein